MVLKYLSVFLTKRKPLNQINRYYQIRILIQPPTNVSYLIDLLNQIDEYCQIKVLL